MKKRIFYLSAVPIFIGFLIMLACIGEWGFWLGVGATAIGVGMMAKTEPEVENHAS